MNLDNIHIKKAIAPYTPQQAIVFQVNEIDLKICYTKNSNTLSMMLLMMKTIQSIDYKSDFALWLEETVANLKSQNFQQVDWENLIEEVEFLGKRTAFINTQKKCDLLLTKLLKGLVKVKGCCHWSFIVTLLIKHS